MERERERDREKNSEQPRSFSISDPQERKPATLTLIHPFPLPAALLPNSPGAGGLGSFLGNLPGNLPSSSVPRATENDSTMHPHPDRSLLRGNGSRKSSLLTVPPCDAISFRSQLEWLDYPGITSGDAIWNNFESDDYQTIHSNRFFKRRNLRKSSKIVK